ncbi:hypothetical protein A3A09_02650 [Candidatus Nomurabacteria bacterium RIFCSPLOWO2_01_FULL_42_20]|uniref:Uncharacterized protein n=1 Tax=Candidatus Nomurabacteria bacterium RIFCSPHIGHO2_01_FULL_42_16 TaxID=1801743 RepID=A0A1F6VKP0_9BACT|nr:MAG: hypothetical protein A2824_02575 [Candidatus Nomurabacteria bacterium RIFCSPHIGHO2_01_FULL_42_16]OGI91157.1 MAG: hypothetical protein A3A09_02650 [Candidatus Nomurabacteria bacterium RIFCSPLOWO2_01_FULL_42_20]
MNQKALNWAVGIIFSLISILHLTRSILGWEAVIGGVEISIGVSVVAFLIAGFLAYSAFKLTRGKEVSPSEDKEKIMQ